MKESCRAWRVVQERQIVGRSEGRGQEDRRRPVNVLVTSVRGSCERVRPRLELEARRFNQVCVTGPPRVASRLWRPAPTPSHSPPPASCPSRTSHTFLFKVDTSMYS